MLRRHFADQFFEPNIGAIHQDFASLFRTPDDVSIRFVFMEPVYRTYTAYCVEEKRTGIKGTPYIPMDESRGFTALSGNI